MDINTSAALFSSPPRQSIRSPQLHRISRSGGAMRNSNRPDYRHLSSSSRAARSNDAPWRRRFLEQCVDRANKAREASQMMRRRLLNLADNHSQSNQNAQQLREMTDEEIREIVQQEWTRFRREMEQQSMEYGFLDEDIIADIENDMRLSSGRGGDVYYQESYEDYGMDEHDYNSFMEMEQVEDPEWEEFAGWEQYQDALMMADMEQPQAMDSTGNHRHM